MPEKPETTITNPAETMRDVMADLGHHDAIFTPGELDLSRAYMITVPDGRRVEDLTINIRNAAEYLNPTRRKGTARMADLQSLIGWANRFKGETSALFALPDMAAPTLTCIADYHAGGPGNTVAIYGDPTARHCHHRAGYAKE